MTYEKFLQFKVAVPWEVIEGRIISMVVPCYFLDGNNDHYLMIKMTDGESFYILSAVDGRRLEHPQIFQLAQTITYQSKINGSDSKR